MKKFMSLMLILSMILSGIILNPNQLEIHAEDTATNLDISKIELAYIGEDIVITGYGGEFPENEVIFPSEIEGRKVTKIGYEAFKNRQLKGKVVLGRYVDDVAAFAFQDNNISELVLPAVVVIGQSAFENNKIENLHAPKLKELWGSVFKNNEIRVLDLPGLEIVRANDFRNNDIEELVLPSVVDIGRSAFEDNQVEKLYAPQLKNIDEGAFYKQMLQNLYLPELENVGINAFYDNNIISLHAEKLKFVGVGAFANNHLKDLKAPNIVKIEDSAFSENQLVDLELESVKSIGARAFEANELKRFVASNLEAVGEGAFYNNHLETLTAPKLKEIGTNAFRFNQLEDVFLEEKPSAVIEGAFSDNKSNQSFMEYFPIYLQDETVKNIFDFYAGIVYNPEKETFINDKFEQLDQPLEEGQKYLASITDVNHDYYSFATAHDFNGDLYYCVDSKVDFSSGVYQEIADVEKVFIIEFGDKLVGYTPEDEYRPSKVSINKEPEAQYAYSYDAELLSKLIYHGDKLRQEYNYYGYDYNFWRLVHVIASNINEDGQPGFVNQEHLTVENAHEKIKGTDTYQSLISNQYYDSYYDEEIDDSLGQDFVDEVFRRVENDERDFTLASYWVNAVHKFNEEEISQPVFKPGKPVRKKRDLSIEKVWKIDGQVVEPKDNKDLDFPNEIKVDIFKNGDLVDQISLNQDNNWQYIYQGLDFHDEMGVPYEYSVVEKEVPNFESNVVGDMDQGFIIVNEKFSNPPTPNEPPSVDEEPPTPNEPPSVEEKPPVVEEPPKTKEPGLPATGMGMNKLVYGLALLLVSLGFVLILKDRNRKLV